MSTLLSTPAAAQIAPKVENQEIYEALYAQLMDFLTAKQKLKTSTTQLQLVPEFIDADWGELDPLTNVDVRAHQQAARCNVMPLGGQVYSAASYNLFDEYRKFLRSVKFPKAPDSADQATINAAKTAWDTATTAYQKGLTDADTAHVADNVKRAAAGQPTRSRQAYDAQTGTGKVLGGLEQNVITSATTYFAALGTLSGNYDLVGDMLQETSDQANRPSLLGLGGGVDRLPIASIQPSISAWAAAAAQLPLDAEGKAASGVVLDTRKSHKTSNITTRTAGGGASAGGLFGFFRALDASGNNTTTTVNTSDASFDVRITFTAVSRFECTRNPWFDGGLLRAFTKKSDFISGANAIYSDPIKSFFGDDGTLSLIPMSFVVAIRPKMSIVLSAADYQQVKSAWQASTSFGFGPFETVHGGASGTADNQIWNDAGNEITIGSPTTRPVVIAVYSEIHHVADDKK